MRSFKKIAAMIMAVAMLCSFTALGASVEIGSITFDNNVANIKYTPEGVDEVTALVFSGDINSNANIVYIDQFNAIAKKEEGLSIDFHGEEEGSYTLYMGGTGVTTASAKSIDYTQTTRTFSVSLASVANGYIKCDTDLTGKLDEGTEITLTFAPYVGYTLASFKIGGVEKSTAVSRINGEYTYKHVVEDNTSIAVTFTAITEGEAGKVDTYDVVNDVEGDKVVFGKAFVGTAGATIVKTGMKVEKYVDGNWVPFGTDGIFEATAGRDDNNAYGIHFQGFAEGKYRVSAYVYFDGVADPVYGDAVEFTVG